MAFSVIALPDEDSADYTPVAADGSNGNKFQNDGKRRLYISNPLGASITCTIATPKTVDGNAVEEHVVDGGAFSDTTYIVKALDPDIYNVQSGTDQGAVTMTWSGTLTDVVLSVI